MFHIITNNPKETFVTLSQSVRVTVFPLQKTACSSLVQLPH